jgi:putative sigma-54 modulation protein
MMNISTTSRHYELTPALKDYAESKVYNLKKYFDQIVNAHITFSLEKYRHAVEITVHVNGRDFASKEETEDMYISVDKVVEKLERQILKHKGKIRKRKAPKIATIEYSFPDEGQENSEAEAPVETELVRPGYDEFPELTLEAALKEIRVNGQNYKIYSNAETKMLNILYLREDGKFGLIEV